MARKYIFSDEQLLELYWQGLTNAEIAEQLHVTQAAVYYRLGKIGLVNNCRKQDVDIQQVKILHKLALTSVGIALLLKVSAAAVSDKLVELGLKDNYYKLKEIISQ